MAPASRTSRAVWSPPPRNVSGRRPEPNTPGIGGLDDRLRIGEGRRQRLLGVDVLAGLDGGEADLRVTDRRREVDHDVDRGIGEQVGQRQRAEAGHGGERGGPGRVGVRAGDELDGRQRRAPGDVVLRDVAAADEGDASGTDAGHDAAQPRDERARPRPTRYSMEPETASITGPSAWSSSTMSHSTLPPAAAALDRGSGIHDAAPDRAVREPVAAARAGRRHEPVLDVQRADARPEVADDGRRRGAADDYPEDVDLEVDRGIGRVADERVRRTGALDVVHLEVVVVEPEADAVAGGDRGARVQRAGEATDLVTRPEVAARHDHARGPEGRGLRAHPVECVRIVDRCPGVGAGDGKPGLCERVAGRGDIAAGTPTVSTPP